MFSHQYDNSDVNDNSQAPVHGGPNSLNLVDLLTELTNHKRGQSSANSAPNDLSETKPVSRPSSTDSGSPHGLPLPGSVSRHNNIDANGSQVQELPSTILELSRWHQRELEKLELAAQKELPEALKELMDGEFEKLSLRIKRLGEDPRLLQRLEQLMAKELETPKTIVKVDLTPSRIQITSHGKFWPGGYDSFRVNLTTNFLGIPKIEHVRVSGDIGAFHRPVSWDHQFSPQDVKGLTYKQIMEKAAKLPEK